MKSEIDIETMVVYIGEIVRGEVLIVRNVQHCGDVDLMNEDGARVSHVEKSKLVPIAQHCDTSDLRKLYEIPGLPTALQTIFKKLAEQERKINELVSIQRQSDADATATDTANEG